MYADAEYYKTVYKGSSIPDDELEKALDLACMHIDSLTYNRIVAAGIENLTEFQSTMIRKVCCMQADFEYDNADVIQSILKNYSINGVSMEFGESWNVKVKSGVAIRKDLYDMLCQTGLCDKRCI